MRNTTKLFSIHRWPTGHMHICFLNWTADWNPVRKTWWFMNRPWPSARKGLAASEMRSFHIKIR